MRAAQGIERVMNDTPRPTSEQSQTTGFHTSYREESSSEERKEWVIIRAITEKKGEFCSWWEFRRS